MTSRRHLKLIEGEGEDGPHRDVFAEGHQEHAFPDGCNVIVSNRGGPLSEEAWEQLHETTHRLKDRHDKD